MQRGPVTSPARRLRQGSQGSELLALLWPRSPSESCLGCSESSYRGVDRITVKQRPSLREVVYGITKLTVEITRRQPFNAADSDGQTAAGGIAQRPSGRCRGGRARNMNLSISRLYVISHSLAEPHLAGGSGRSNIVDIAYHESITPLTPCASSASANRSPSLALG